MLVTYTPEDGDRQEWDFKPGRVRASEAALMEKQFGANWDELVMGVQSGNIKARRVMLWHLLRRDHPRLRFEDTPDFYADELVVEFTVTELVPMRERLEKVTMPEDQRAQVLAALDVAISEAMDREQVEEPGKALSPTPQITGGSSSPQS